jgi:hypothetical protein
MSSPVRRQLTTSVAGWHGLTSHLLGIPPSVFKNQGGQTCNTLY